MEKQPVSCEVRAGFINTMLKKFMLVTGVEAG
jgi:hypothetical protein